MKGIYSFSLIICIALSACCKKEHVSPYTTDAVIVGVVLDNCATCCGGYMFKLSSDVSGTNYFATTLPASDIDFTTAHYPIAVQMDYKPSPQSWCNRQITVQRIRRK